jgi:hypothetical protein
LPSAFLVLAAVIFAGLAVLTLRDHRILRNSRRSLLDPCLSGLRQGTVTVGGDGFPRLSGTHHGQPVKVELIPDTMVIRRLPQLWLSVTLLQRRRSLPTVSILIRHTGNEFYSITAGLECRLEPPRGFPVEVMVRGDCPRSQQLLDHLAPKLSAILADPKAKEVCVTGNGVRIIRQAGEGRRGEHLLLRQAMFDGAHVSSDVLAGILDDLQGLGTALASFEGARAA